tara:strand:+ start:16 stop:327 length:312 start_codon:yes stop_codon:yes gene_type:complete
MVNKETNKSKLTITIFFTPVDHKMMNSPLLLCLKIKITNDVKNAIGKNFGAIPKMFKIEYLKYVDKEYPLSTIKSKKLTALTVSAIKHKPEIIIKNVLNISKK